MTVVRGYRAPAQGGLLRKPRSGLLEPLDIPKELPPQLDLPEGRFLNREASWLDFNARVLALAEHPDTPLLERAKFLAIFAGNLDEFFMVRVAGLKRRQAARLAFRTIDGLSLGQQLRAISERTSELMARQSACFLTEVLPGLDEEGIRLVHWDHLGDREQARLQGYFREQVLSLIHI